MDILISDMLVSKQLSFKNKVKKDLCVVPFESEGCMRAELAGILTPNSKLMIGDDNHIQRLIFHADQAEVVERIKKLSQSLFQFQPLVKEIEPGGILTSKSFELTFKKNPESMLKDLRMIKWGSEGQLMGPSGVPPFFRKKQRFLKAYLRGVFLACGTIMDPEKGYRLELSGNNESYMQDIRSVLALYELNFNLFGRHKHFILYAKEAESVSVFLNLIGAHKALLGMENIRAFREVRNDVNRKVNCDLANLQRTGKAAEKQLSLIREIESQEGLVALPEELRQLALMRKNNPDMTIQELGKEMNPPVGKSAVFKRFEKMERLHLSYRAGGKIYAKNKK